MTTTEMRKNLEILVTEHNSILSADEVDYAKLSEKKAAIEEALKELNAQLEADEYNRLKGAADPAMEMIKVGYFKAARIYEDKKNGDRLEVNEKDQILSMPRMLEIMGQKEKAATWKTMCETLTFRLSARAYKDMGQMDTKEARENFSKLYKASEEAKKSNEKDPLSNGSLRALLQKCADFACFVPSEADEALNVFKLDERYVKWFLYVAFKESKGRGASIACPRPGTIGKLIVVALYTLINDLDFRVECKQLAA